MKPVESLSDDEFSQRVHQAVRSLPDAPLPWQQAAINRFVAKPAPLAEAAQALRRFIVAALTFDSWAAPALAHGMRSLRSPTRHLLYSAQGRDLDLRIAPSAERFALSGQVLGPDEAGRIELVPEGLPAAQGLAGTLDALGEFRIDDVPRGRYVLTLHLGPEPIVVQALEVGEPAP